MPSYPIYFNEEMFSRIRKEDNISRLINKLLADYFQTFMTPEEKLEIEEQKKKDLQKTMKKLKKEVENKQKQLEILQKQADLEPKTAPRVNLSESMKYEKWLKDKKEDYHIWTFEKWKNEADSYKAKNAE